MELDIFKIVNKHRKDRGALISILEDIQTKYGYLPTDALKIVAERTNHALVDVYGLATFYRAFSLKPRGEHLVSACVGTSCHVRGAPGVVDELNQQLKIKSGETTPDNEFTLETVNCLGACALSPIVVVDGHYFPHVSSTEIKDIIHKARVGIDRVDLANDPRIFPITVSCPRCNYSLMDSNHLIEGHPSILLKMVYEQRRGWIRLSSLYGSNTVQSEFEIHLNTVVHFFCPHCEAELIGATQCYECDSPMVLLNVEGGAILQMCSLQGCKNHLLDLSAKPN